MTGSTSHVRRFRERSEETRIREDSYEILEYVFGLLETGASADALAAPADGETVAYHSHCQQRTLGLEAHTVAVLERLGYDVRTSDAECCGMAGSFGYKVEYYDLAEAVGDDLREAIAALDPDRVATSGTSCTEQVGADLETEPRHPIELIAPPE